MMFYWPITSIVSLLIALGDPSGSYKQHGTWKPISSGLSISLPQTDKEFKLISNGYDIVLKPLS